MKYTKTKIHISEARQGDTILHNGELKTLTNSYIKRCPFMGVSIWGDSYQCGNKPVIRVSNLQF